MNITPLLLSEAESTWSVSLDGTPDPKPSCCIEFDTDVEAARALVAYLAPRPGTRVLQVVMSRPPGPVSDVVDVEDLRGNSLSGSHMRADGYFVLFVREAL